MNHIECFHFGEYQSGSGEDRKFTCRKHGSVTLGECAGCKEFVLPEPLDNFDMKVAVTTCFHRRHYYPQVRKNLNELGIPYELYPDLCSREKYHAFGNFYVAMTSLAMKFPNATAYMYLQDDTILSEHPQVLHLTNLYHFDDTPFAIVSLYNSDEMVIDWVVGS